MHAEDTRVSRSASPKKKSGSFSYSFDHLSSQIVDIILAYLLPRDLARCLYLSSCYHKLTSVYIRVKIGANLLEKVCPKCGNDWISTFPIDEFIDIDEDEHYFDVLYRRDYINRVFPVEQATRKHLLCDDCENDIQESTSVSHFVLHNYSTYQLYVDLFSRYPWACLVKHENATTVWNQFRCVIPVLSGLVLEEDDGEDDGEDGEDEEGDENDGEYKDDEEEENDGEEEEEEEEEEENDGEDDDMDETYSDPEYEYDPEDWV